MAILSMDICDNHHTEIVFMEAHGECPMCKLMREAQDDIMDREAQIDSLNEDIRDLQDEKDELEEKFEEALLDAQNERKKNAEN